MKLFQRPVAAAIFENRCAGRSWYRAAENWRVAGAAPSIATSWFERLQAEQQLLAELAADHRRPLDLADIARLAVTPVGRQPASRPERLTEHRQTDRPASDPTIAAMADTGPTPAF